MISRLYVQRRVPTDDRGQRLPEVPRHLLGPHHHRLARHENRSKRLLQHRHSLHLAALPSSDQSPDNEVFAIAFIHCHEGGHVQRQLLAQQDLQVNSNNIKVF